MPTVELGLEEVQKLFKLPKTWGWVQVDDYQMFLGGNDDGILLRFMHGHQYETTSRDIWKKLCVDADLVADIGTHSGVFTLDAYSAGAKTVLSVEPHPINFSRLILNLRYNGFPPYGAYLGAVGDEERQDTLLVKQLYMVHAGGRVGLHNPKGFEVPVNVKRLESILPEEGWPHLKAVKIDAENYTLKALKGMGKILDHKPDLLLECTEVGMDEILRPYGYRFWTIWEDGKVEEIDHLTPNNPNGAYNGTIEDNKNRFASVRGLP